MAALDCFLELDPVELSAGSPGQLPAVGPTTAPAPADAWAWKKQLKLAPHAHQAQAAVMGVDDDVSLCTSSPGCSYSGAAALGASLLDLADDACSGPQPGTAPTQPYLAASLARPGPVQQLQPSQSAALPGSAALVAATFFDDLAAGGSLYEYCLQR